MIFLRETDMLDRVETVRNVVAFAAPPNEEVLRDNPLGKIPTLVRDDGSTMFDSRVICEYLDGLHDRARLLPPDGEARFRHLRWQALGDGLTDLLLLWRTELMRPAGPSDVLTSAFARKVRASMERLEAEADDLAATPFGLGHISIACTIGQLDFRFTDSRWKEAFPLLAAWYATVSARPSIAATAPQDDPSPTVTGQGFTEGRSPIDFMAVA